MRKEKEPYVARKMCATQGSIFSFFLGIHRMPNFAFFIGSDDAEISQKHIVTLYGHYINKSPL